MRATASVGLDKTRLRPFKHGADKANKTFPVYEDLVGDLLSAAENGQPNEVARHVCAVLSTWSYSDPETVAQMMARMGLLENHTRCVEISNNANFIRSSAFLVQSKCRRVVLLVYRGTDPFDLSTWAVSSDAKTVPMPPAPAAVAQDDARVHAGFYRNQRATWYDVATALKQAALGESILKDLPNAPSSAQDAPPSEWPGTTRLFITGHSLGGAMAILAGYRIMFDAAYTGTDPHGSVDAVPALRPLLHSVYTFAQPMVGNRGFADRCNAVMQNRLFCHTYREDVVPHLPPDGLGVTFVHAGFHFAANEPPYVWKGADAPRPAASVLALAWAALGMLTQYEEGKTIVGELTRHLGFLRELSNRLQQAKDNPEGVPVTAIETVVHGASNVVGTLINAVGQLFGSHHQPQPAKPEGRRSYSFAFHAPLNYLAASQPSDKLTEFGNDF